MNLGCGTLLALLLLVVVAGNLIPHEPGSPAHQGGQAHDPKAKKSGPGQVTHREKVGKPQESESTSSALPSFESMLSGLKTWIDQKAKEAGENVAERAALPPGTGPTAEILAKVGEEAKTIVTERVGQAVALGTASSSVLSTSSQDKKVAKPAASPSTGSPRPTARNVPEGSHTSPGTRVAVEGRDPVFNNPWNRAVEPVERYLKQHVHDAASIELLEWGQVEVIREGYQVRCVYKSKNVLGKMTTQSRLFVMDHAGKVVDIRD